MSAPESLPGSHPDGMRYADLHIHGVEDDGRLTIPEMVTAAQSAGLSAIGVTLHDNYSFGYRVKNFVAQQGIDLEVYAGSEVTAMGRDGKDVHVLVYETDGDIPPYQSIYDTYNQAVRRGGFAVFPHPDSRVEGSGRMEELIDLNIPIHVEVFNAGVRDLDRLAHLKHPFLKGSNAQTKKTYELYKDQLGAEVGGSDAHKFKLGQGRTMYSGDLRQSLEQKTTIAVPGGSEWWSLRDIWIHNQKVAELTNWRNATYPRPKGFYDRVVLNPAGD